MEFVTSPKTVVQGFMKGSNLYPHTVTRRGKTMEEKNDQTDQTDQAELIEQTEQTERREKLSLYDRIKCNMGLVDNFINCMNGFGSAARMTEQEKRDFVNRYSIEDVEILYMYDFI